MDVTTYYSLKKPSGEFFYDIQNENDNMDIIDAELHRFNITGGDLVGSIYPCECEYDNGVFALSSDTVTETLPDIFTVRFKAPADYIVGDQISFRDVNYHLVLPNGSVAPYSAFLSGAVVLLNMDMASQKAYLIWDSRIILPELRILTQSDVVVTASLNNKVFKATADSTGNATLILDELGTWILSATIDGVLAEVPYVIDAVKIFNTALSVDLQDTSWELINKIAQSGNASQLWEIGDTKTLFVGGTEYVAKIIGFDHDDLTDGGKAGITFQFDNCLDTTYRMNSTSTNVGGWSGSEMYTTTLPNLLEQFPLELKNIIKPVNKLTSAGNQSSTINTTSDGLFLLSEVEVFGAVTYSKAGEGTQYEYYAAGNSRIKNVNGSPAVWWERSPRGSNATYFCGVNSDGSASNSVASNACGVAPGFCI